MEWFKHCSACNNEGRILSIDEDKSLISFICDSCSYAWEVEIQCDNYLQDHYSNDLCNIDSSIGDCRGSLCPRLEKIKYYHSGDSKQLDSEQINEVKTPNQTQDRR